MSQTSAELVVKCLEKQGVEYVFSIPAAKSTPFLMRLLIQKQESFSVAMKKMQLLWQRLMAG
ncbi:MAG: thiamine pyrophosphate-dependent acetolactate synthase large subunit-like protein [Francisellaceae bacterium]|jgi:thiamine pyrophosphate-dependent acetolactate synthase large subunit-like protein